MAKCRPILFSAPMVRAIIEGRKTQTRRIVKPQPGPCDHSQWPEANDRWRAGGDDTWCCGVCGNGMRLTKNDAVGVRCPYGKPGDRLWVRETFLHTKAEYCYEASASIPVVPADTIYAADCADGVKGAGFSPSIFMPRHLSRITLEIIEVRVQRLRDISCEDVLAEGAPYCNREYSDGSVGCVGNTEWFHELWDSINSERGFDWDANPWVWALTFKRI